MINSPDILTPPEVKGSQEKRRSFAARVVRTLSAGGCMQPNRADEKARNTDLHKPDDDRIPVMESDNDAPGIAPTKPSSMPRAEDDPETWRRSPEYHDRSRP
jgi:hypothetical protein